jgi:hypothetical protein
MGATFRFLAMPDESQIVLDWFRSLPEEKVEHNAERGLLFYFRQFGPMTKDARTSPVVSVFPPRRVRGVLTTVGEVHFLATPTSQFPKLRSVSTRFRKWLGAYPCVFSHQPNFPGNWDYYLEGSLKNVDTDIFALPEGMAALERGSYFVGDGDINLDPVCRQLELRDVRGIEPT